MGSTRVLLWSGALLVGALALTESFVLLPAVFAAYAGAGRVLVLERHATRSGGRR
ncbi:hypothetical protein [Nocardioides pyridinolyticus]